MSKRVRSHCVPKLYLKRFVSQSDRAKVIHRYDKTTGESVATGINGIAVERGYYDFALRNGTLSQLEPELSKIEGPSNTAIDELLKAGTPVGISQECKGYLAAFVALQMLRGPLNRLLLVQADSFMKTMGIGGDEELPEQTENELKRQHAVGMADCLPGFTGMLLDCVWTMQHNTTGWPLWTSDSPVCMFHPLGLCPGLGVPGTWITMPLTPSHVLRLCVPPPHLHLPAFTDIAGEEVLFYNRRQVRDSIRYVFSQNGDFHVADEYLIEFPQYRDVDRPLFEVVGPADFASIPQEDGCE